VLGELIARCDVLVNSLRPGVLESWGFTEEVLKTSSPALVVVHASAFGRTGPKASQGGYDPVAQGFSGLSGLTGDAGGPPMRAGGAIPVCDFMTGLVGALGAVLSLYARDRVPGGGGQTVDVALYDFAFRMTGPLLSYFDLSGEISSRNGNHSLGGAPTGHFLTVDDHWICVSVQNDEQFRRLARLMERSEWLTDDRFADLGSRTKHRETLCSEFADWARSQTRDSLIERFDDHGVVPDIVVLGKGISNGFPLSAVIARREIAEAMAHRKFFNTYAANPVSCAAGLSPPVALLRYSMVTP